MFKVQIIEHVYQPFWCQQAHDKQMQRNYNHNVDEVSLPKGLLSILRYINSH